MENRENKDTEEQDNQQSEINLTQYLLNNGKVFYINDSIHIEALIADVENRIIEELKFDTSYSLTNNIHILDYSAKGGFKASFGIKNKFKLFFIVEGNKMYYDIKNDKWFEDGEDKFSLNKVFSNSKDSEIGSFISAYLMKNTIRDSYSTKLDTNNHFINKLSDKQKLWFYSWSADDEIMLAFLLLSSMQNGEGDINSEKDVSWYFFVTSDKINLVAFSKREEVLQIIDCLPNTIKVKKELGRNSFHCNNIDFLCTRSNNSNFYSLSKADLSQESRIREVARLNWIHSEHNDESNYFAIELIKLLIDKNHDIVDDMSLLYMEYSKGNKEEVFSNFLDNNRLLLLLNKILVNPNSNEWLINWTDQWQVPYIDIAAINDLLIASIDNQTQANNILPFHRFIRTKFHEKDADKINNTLFDIRFCKHLIRCGLDKEAKKILKKNLKQLPNEKFLDLLPGKDLDLTGSAAGQVIKVSILELLVDIDSDKNAIAHKRTLASLQPLVELRIEELIKMDEKELTTKGMEMKELMLPKGIAQIDKENETQINYSYKKIDSKLLDKYIRYPIGKKGDQFTKIQKWLATIKTDDYSILKSYSEPLSSQKHKDLSNIVNDIKHALDIQDLEVYIARGDKSFGIRSFEGKPNFLLVGINHLEEDSAHYLSSLELRFAIASELAHLYFKHARITSNDVWRGVLDKGSFVLDALLIFIPVAGLFGKSIQGISKLNRVSSFIQSTSKAEKITSTSREILSASEKVVGIYKSKSKKAKKERDKEQEFWATARIIQSTSDRCALMFTQDLKAAVRSILILSKYYNSEMSVIEEKGLREYMLEKEEDGTFANQELAIRLSNLFSFYLSEEYTSILKALGVKTQNTDNKPVGL